MNIIVALLIFGLLVTFHELGHFLLAKKNGIMVIEFSIGMGPRLLSKVKNGTRYSLKLFPIGGSCQMGEDDPEYKEGSFHSKSVWARISTIFAGPFFNFVLAFVIALIVIGNVGYDPAIVTNVPEGSLAAKAGLQPGDVITEIDGKNVVFARDIVLYTDVMGIDSNDPITVKYKRDGESKTTKLTPTYTKKFMLGFYYDPGTNKVGEIMRNSAMGKAGIEAGDTILKINGVELTVDYTLGDYLSDNPIKNETLIIDFKQKEENKTAFVTPKMTEIYDLGFSYNQYYEKTDFFGTIRYSFGEVRYWMEATVRSLGQLFTGKFGMDDISGPARIVNELGNVVEAKDEYGLRLVIMQLLQWAIVLSANLGIMNLLPIPALDGGRLMFLIIEAVRGKPISREKEGYVHFIGFIILMVLMVFVFFNDIKNIFF